MFISFEGCNEDLCTFLSFFKIHYPFVYESCVDTLFCNLHLISHGGQNDNFTLKICILILVIRSLISFHKNYLDIITIKLIGHKP